MQSILSKTILKSFFLYFFFYPYFFVQAQCPVTPPIGKDSCKLSAGSVELGVSGSTGYYSWYDSNIGGSFVGGGNTFITPSISSSTTYYVAAADTNIALDFDGTNDYVALGNPAQLQITGDMTVEMWLKPNNFSARRNPYAKAYGGEGTITQETSGSLSYYYGTNGGNGNPYQGFSSGNALILNQWNHIAIVRDLTNMKLYWYINGILTSQVNATYALATAGVNPATIGSGYVSNYDGQIDELRIWNVARTQVQIQNAMNTCLTGLEANLVAYYPLNSGTGSAIAYDLTPFANNGTLTSMNPPTDWVAVDYDFTCTSCESPRTAVTATISGGSPVNLGNDTIFNCGITSITLDAGVGYVNYLWNTGETTQTINTSTTGEYWVKVDDGGSCTDGDTINVSNSSGSLYTLDFDGTNDYVALGNPAQLQITGDMTIEMWLKPDNFSARRNPYAKAYGGEGTITQETSGALNYYYGTNGGNSTPYQGFSSGSVLTLNQWNHIAIVRDLTNMKLYWYINGVLTSQVNATYALATAGVNPATIGSGYVSNYDGQIDELRIWNIARTQIELQSKMCSKLLGSETGLVAYYRFDEGAGATLNDITSNNNNGTLTNSPTWNISSASIGDNSTYLYTGSWAGKTLSLSFCSSGESLTVSNMSGAPSGVHIYSVGNIPNDTTGITGLGSNNRYFGVHKINDPTATYTATYNYTGNTHVSSANEPLLLLFTRSDNSDSPWSNSAAILNQVGNTLIVNAQGTEFILGSSGVSLPVKLISFNATLIKNNVWFDWKTETEINNDYFTIERSSNLEYWESLKEVKGAGNSNSVLSYSTVDQKPLEGISYYRLKQTDFNGEYSYSKIAVVNYKDLTDILIYPNPVKDVLNIKSDCNDCQIKVYSAVGQLVYSGNSKEINTSNWTKGIYEVVIFNSIGEIEHKARIVK